MPSDLEYHLGFWLRFVSNAVSGSFRDRVVAYGVTVAEWVALRSLHGDTQCTLRDLASRMGVDTGATSRLVERLSKKKFITRDVSPADRRAVSISLTPAGRTLVARLAREADKNDDHFFRKLPKNDQQHLARILRNLVKLHGLKEKPTN